MATVVVWERRIDRPRHHSLLLTRRTHRFRLLFMGICLVLGTKPDTHPGPLSSLGQGCPLHRLEPWLWGLIPGLFGLKVPGAEAGGGEWVEWCQAGRVGGTALCGLRQCQGPGLPPQVLVTG